MGEAREDDKGTVVDKQWHTEEQVDGTLIRVDVDVHEQEALLLSYRLTQVYDGMDDAASSRSVVPRCHDDEVGTTVGATGSEDE